MVSVTQIFREELARKTVSITFLDRMDVEYEPLTPEEEDAVKLAFQTGLELMERVSPTIASSLKNQLSAFLKWAGVAKAMFDGKPIAFPSTPGTIGVNWLFPQAIRYASTCTATSPCYTSYPPNSWDLTLTAGTPVYFFGDGTNFYRASSATNRRAFIVVAQDGIVEIGTTPKLGQFRVWSEISSKYGIWTAHPLVEVSIEPGKALYQYPTLGMIPVYPDLGIMWKALPVRSGTSTVKLLGLVFYEHDFAPDTVWVA